MTTAPCVVPAVRNRGALAAICCAILFLYAAYLAAMGVVLPSIAASFGRSVGQVGALFPANFAGFVVGVLVCGYLSDRLGRKRVILIGLVLFAGGLLIFGMAGTFTVALFAYMLVGAGTGACETVASALASDVYPERRAFVLNSVQIAFGVGASLVPVLAHRLLAAGVPWPWYYFALAALIGVLFCVLARLDVPLSSHAEALDVASLREALLRPAFGVLCVAQMLYVGAEVAFFSWMPTLFIRSVAGGAAWAGAVVTVFWVAMTAGRIATSAVVDRVPIVAIVAVLSGAGAFFSALAVTRADPLTSMCFVALTGLAFSGIWPLVLAEGGARFPGIAGTAFGGIVAAGGAGGALVPWAVAAIATGTGNWRGSLLLVPACSAGVALAMAVLRRTDGPHA